MPPKSWTGGVHSHFGAQRCHGGLDKGFSVVRVEREGLTNQVQLVDGDASCLVITIRDTDGVDPPVQQLLCLLQESPSQHWKVKDRGIIKKHCVQFHKSSETRGDITNNSEPF